MGKLQSRRKGSIERNPIFFSSPYIMYASGRAIRGNKKAIDCNDYSLFILVKINESLVSISGFCCCCCCCLLRNKNKNGLFDVLLQCKQFKMSQISILSLCTAPKYEDDFLIVSIQILLCNPNFLLNFARIFAEGKNKCDNHK